MVTAVTRRIILDANVACDAQLGIEASGNYPAVHRYFLYLDGFGYNHASSATTREPTGSATPSIIWSRWESPELESPSSLLAFVCNGFDVEDVGAADVLSPFKSVAVCGESPPEVEVEVVVAPVAPVALATGTSIEPAVAVVVDVGPEFPSATLPHMNITTMTSLS